MGNDVGRPRRKENPLQHSQVEAKYSVMVRSYKKCCHCCTVSLVPATSIILAVVFFGGFIALPIVFTTDTVRIQYQYGMVIDAGSSHTSLYVYSWNVSTNGTGFVQQVYTKSTGDPLTSYAADPSMAGPNILQLVTGSSSFVKGDPDYIQLFLGATAGMRLLRDTNFTATIRILQSVKSSLKPLPYNFISAEIISGTSEGLYAWITLNYLNKKVPPKGQDNSTGVLDMGGASLQIAMEYNGWFTPQINCNGNSVTLFGQDYNLYTCSYLCYGRDRAESKLLDYLISSQPNATVITNPCFPAQYTHTYLSSDIYDGWCVRAESGTAQNYSFSGTGNSSACWSLVDTVFNGTLPQMAVPIQGNFIGISTFYFAASYIYNTSNPLPITNLDGYNSSVFKFCNTPLTSPSSSIFIGDACFNGMYTLFMLRNVLGFGSTTNWTLSFNKKVNGEDIGWSLGYMLNSTVGLQDHISTPFLVADLVVGMIVLAILCVVFVAFFIFTFLPCKKAIMKTNGYSPLS